MAFDARSWRSPDTLSAFGTVADSDVPALRARLARCEAALRLDELPMLHYLRLFVIDADHDLRGRPLAARLVMSAVFDGEVDGFLAKWVELAGDELVALLGHCVDGPSGYDEVAPFLLERSVRPDTFHIGTVHSSLAQIREEHRLATALRAFVDANFIAPESAVNAREVRKRALAFVRSRPDLPQQPRPARTLLSRVLQYADLVRSAGIVFAGAPVSGLAAVLVRYLELTEPDVVVRQDDALVKELEDLEDLAVQNQFTMVAPVRDSVARRLILQATLFVSDAFSKHFSTAGRLVGVETIHFARIHQIDEGRRFLFMSDFDGGWNRYLFDFLTTGAFAVVPNWTNLLGCPKTRFLLVPGRGFNQRFLPFTRARQVRTDVWYAAVPDLTVHDIIKHAEIRRGLFSNCDSDAQRWVRLL